MSKRKLEYCPACEQEQLVDLWLNSARVVCTRCKHTYYVGKHSFLNRAYALFYFYFNKWIRSNWVKVRTENYGGVISERVIYKNGCWCCGRYIVSVMENREVIYGNPQCEKPGCNHFICEECGMCLCDRGLSSVEHNKKVTAWKELKKGVKPG